jgi:hypothetical protein
MSETHQQRLARLTELARKVWPDCDLSIQLRGIHDVVNGDAWDVVEEGDDDSVCYMRAETIDALEAALCVLAGEVPQWAVALAERWLDNASKDYVIREGDDACFEECARELLEAAKGGTP